MILRSNLDVVLIEFSDLERVDHFTDYNRPTVRYGMEVIVMTDLLTTKYR